MAFRKNWRTHQARLLARLDFYLEDRRLHIVAAPGSGKTIFGLEVVRRLNQPTLILAPTITIRNQWLERMSQQFFADGSSEPQWASTDLRDPQFLTIATYQALHALCSGDPEETEDAVVEDEVRAATSTSNEKENANSAIGNELPDRLRGFKTLVLDEAHHLRSEWWRTLNSVVEQMKPTLVALTATPPYDVSPLEWQRYEDLCGPVDAEVAVPELVLQGDLCPHQDYVFFSTPGPAELKKFLDFRASVEAFVEQIKANHDFAAAVTRHPWIIDPDCRLEEILDNPEYLSSMVAFLKSAGHEIPKPVLKALGAESKSVPDLSLEWLEILLTEALYADAGSFQTIDAMLKSLRRDLVAIGAVERRRVVLRQPSDHSKLLTTSKAKLHSIEEIVRLESGSLQSKLRCAILTDYIRKSDLPKTSEDPAAFEDIGAVPIFETLRCAAIPTVRLGVLCGSLVIIPASVKDLAMSAAEEQGLELSDLVFDPMPHDSDYLRVQIAGENRQNSVRLITSLFERGQITVLIGTKSLLGEGWDAPTINTLILATFVGSFVLSNQMRGRSIRIDPAIPEKTANVWHLVCIEPGPFGPGNDYLLLSRRFAAFVGVNPTSLAIENGIERLGFPQPPYSEQQILDLNGQTTRRALDRDALRRDWTEALASGQLKQIIHGLKTDEDSLPRKFVFRNTIAALMVQGMLFFSTTFSAMARTLGRFRADDPLLVPTVVLGLATVAGLPWIVVALWRMMRHGTPERSMEKIGYTVLDSLLYEGSISTASAELSIQAEHLPDGSIYCWLKGGTGRDQAIFIRTLREVLRPIENSRYLLAKGRFWRLFGEDYFAVPEVLGRKKNVAQFFATKWRRQVGPVQLVYTREADGRRILLRARTRSLASAFQPRAERLSCWK